MKYVRKIKFKWSYLKYVLLFLCIIPCFVNTFTSSKYIMNYVYDNFLISKDFYFVSSVLDGSTYNTYDWDPKRNYIFTVNVSNFADKLRWTQEDILYEVSIDCDPSIEGNVSCVGSSGTIVSGETGTTVRIPIVLSNPNNIEFEDNDYVTMRITVRSTSPYSKTISGTIIIHVKNNSVFHTITDSVDSTYGDLVINNHTDETKVYTVSWNYALVSLNISDRASIDIQSYSTYQISNSDSIVTNINGMTLLIPPRTTYSFRYYKSDPSEDYSYPNESNTSIFELIEEQ